MLFPPALCYQLPRFLQICVDIPPFIQQRFTEFLLPAACQAEHQKQRSKQTETPGCVSQGERSEEEILTTAGEQESRIRGGALRQDGREGLTEKVTSVSTWRESQRCLQRTWSELPESGSCFRRRAGGRGQGACGVARSPWVSETGAEGRDLAGDAHCRCLVGWTVLNSLAQRTSQKERVRTEDILQPTQQRLELGS